jgi:hypothetical protein
LDIVPFYVLVSIVSSLHCCNTPTQENKFIGLDMFEIDNGLRSFFITISVTADLFEKKFFCRVHLFV